MNRHLHLFLIVLALAASGPGWRTSALAADNAQQIATEAQRRTTTKSERYEGLLQSFNAGGKTSEKRWIFERLGAHGDSRSVIRFTAPADVRGVALLIVNHPDRPSDQWMWTPALQRDRRIALQDRSTRFFGTDFSFEDLEEREAAHYDHTLLGEEAVGGAAAWRLQAVPKPSRSSQYTRQVLWIRKNDYAVVRIDSYVKDRVVRRLDMSDIRAVNGILTAHDTVMHDLPRGTRTRLTLDKVEYNLPLSDDDFTLQALRRR
jgi:hypothetical protein